MFFTSHIHGIAKSILLTILVLYISVPEPVSAAVASVDHIRITVYYTEAVAGVAPFFSWWSLPLLLIGCAWVLWKEGYLGGDIVHE